MIEFEVAGPFEMPIKRYKKATLCDEKRIPEFWEKCVSAKGEALVDRNGCYIFCMRRRNIVPYYVGKTWNGFSCETFGAYQLKRYHQVVHTHGTPVFFFIHKKARANEGKVVRDAILKLESYLIQECYRINQELLNIKGKKGSAWSINGVTRKIAGKKSETLRKFRTMLHMRE